jgi:hypothetical protein
MEKIFTELGKDLLKRILDPFGIDYESEFISNVLNPEIPDVVNNKFNIRDAYQFRYKVPTNIMNLYNISLLKNKEYLVGSPVNFDTISNIKEGKLKNYDLILTKNFLDFLFCSSTSDYSSCYSLSSEYSNMAWSGIPTLFKQKNIFMLYVTDNRISKKIEQKLNIKTPTINARAWCYLAYKDNTPYLVIGKIYGDLTLLKDFILMSGYPFIDINYNQLLTNIHEYKFNFNNDDIVKTNGYELHPYYDNLILKGNKSVVRNSGSYSDFMQFDNGNSYYHLLEYGYQVCEFDSNEEDEDYWDCNLCDNRYYDDTYIHFDIQINGRTHDYVCDNCISSLYEEEGTNESYYNNNYCVLMYKLIENNIGHMPLSAYQAEVEDTDIKLNDVIELYQYLVAKENTVIKVNNIVISNIITNEEFDIEGEIKYAISYKAKKAMLEKYNYNTNIAFDPNVILIEDIQLNQVIIALLTSDARILVEGIINKSQNNVDAYLGFVANLTNKIDKSFGNIINIELDETVESMFKVNKNLCRGGFSNTFTNGLAIIWSENIINKYTIKNKRRAY